MIWFRVPNIGSWISSALQLRIEIRSVDAIHHSSSKLSKRDRVFFQMRSKQRKKHVFYSWYAAGNLWEDLSAILAPDLSMHRDGSLCTATSTFHELATTKSTIIITTITIISITTTTNFIITPITITTTITTTVITSAVISQHIEFSLVNKI